MSANFVAAGHLDRTVPLTSYCTGLLLPGERKSRKPMAARLCPDKVRQTHQSLHHVVGFLVAERSRFSPSARAGQVDLPVPEMPPKFRPRGSAGARGAA